MQHISVQISHDAREELTEEFRTRPSRPVCRRQRTPPRFRGQTGRRRRGRCVLGTLPL
ncbi:hypothetical protein EYF80_063211 [Liparis tanakae]|uniref:Uncharacterized protein n=1 Tax=Liparis tanakae TaxID=230148 RepID=A0A4Z2ED47_9TELE|nr:hypothetical protein EYF80_063211 [Liparis tanakae]